MIQSNLTMQLISRKAAREQGLKRYFTGKPCKRGHLSERRVSERSCCLCKTEQSTAWRKEHPERMRAIVNKSHKKTYKEDALAYKLRAKKWKDANPEKYLEMTRTGNRKHYKKDAKKICAHIAQYHKEHPEIGRKTRALRRARKLNQTPVLTTDEQKRIDGNYELAATLTRIMGMQYDVDHIFPISKGGSHHPDNLRIITHAENMRKGAKLIGEY